MKKINNIEENYKLLCSAIIKRAVVDYEKGRDKTKRKNIKSHSYLEGQRLIGDVKRFFYSQWFTQLTNIDGPKIFQIIEENYDKFGKCLLYNEKDDE